MSALELEIEIVALWGPADTFVVFTATVIVALLLLPDGGFASSQAASSLIDQLSVPPPELVKEKVLEAGSLPLLTAEKLRLVGLREMCGLGG